MPFIDKLRFRKAEKKVKTESEEKGKEELHLTKEGKVKKKNEKREKEEELHLTKEGKVKKKVKKNKKKEKEENPNLMKEGKVKKKKHKKGENQDEVDLTEEGKVKKKKKKKKKEKEEESNLTEEEKEKAKQQEKEEKKKKKKDKKEQEELNLTEEEKEDKKHQEKEEKKKKKKDKKEQEEEPHLTKEEREKEKQEKKKQEKEEKRKKKNKELEKEEEPNVTKEEKGKQKQEEKKKQKEKEKKKKKHDSDEKQEEPNMTKEEKVKKKTEKKGKEEESNLTKEKKVKKKNEKSEKEDEPNLTKEKKAKEKEEDKKKQEKEEKRKKKTENKEKEEDLNLTKEEKEKQKKKKQEKEEKVKKKTENREKEEELKLTKEEKGRDKQEEKKKKQKELEDEEEVDGITRFGEAITETEWEGVTRFGETGPIERITTFTSEGSYMVAEKTEDGMQYTDIIPSPNHEIEAGRMAEYETVRIMRTRNMSVIEEEEEEEYEVGEDIDDEGEVVGMNVGVFAEVLAAWVLQEAFQEVGRAWDKVTTAWEEMTYGELVQLRETTHRRELYKTLSMPPENELMKGSERQLSEAELRVRRSLQRLDVPEWMKNAPPQQQGFLLRRRDYGSSSAPAGGWSAYSSKTASMTSLGSSRAVTPNTPTKVVIPTRVATRGVGGIGGITSPASNCSISPSPSDRSGSLFQYPISRWSTSRLNSGTTTPTGSVTSARTTATYTRQPYLGWRSQTSLASLAGSQSSLTSTGSYLTAADRLALGITSYSQRFVKTTPSTQDKENSSSEANAAAPKSENADQNDTGSTNGSVKLQVPPDVADVHSSIKEVTSAIVHYCNESTPSPRASPRGSPRPDGRAPSPRRLVWVESSFVGSRPITSPETPTSSTHAITPTSQLNGHDLPESGEVTSRPPQPPGEYLLAW